MLHRTPSLALSLMMLAAPALAADPSAPAPDETGTTIHLVEQIEHPIARDRLSAILRVEAKGPKPAEVQAEVNRRMQAALERAKSVAAVKVSSGGYAVYRQPPPATNAAAGDIWVASQAMTLTAKDFGAALALIGDLQGTGLVIQYLNFEVAPETLHALQNAMSDEALAALRARAEHVAATMGMAVAHYKSIEIGNVTTRQPVPRFYAMAAAAAPAAPVAAEAGDATATLTVDAQVVLEAKK